jgi:hypothetical protein
MGQHKSKCNNYNNKDYDYKVYLFIRDHGGWDNWIMKKQYDYPCGSEEELHKEERWAYEIFCATLNTKIPNRTKKERAKDDYAKKKQQNEEYNKELYSERKEYYLEYWEKVKQKRLEKIQCECGLFVCKANMPRHKKSKKHQKFILSHTPPAEPKSNASSSEKAQVSLPSVAEISPK